MDFISRQSQRGQSQPRVYAHIEVRTCPRANTVTEASTDVGRRQQIEQRMAVTRSVHLSYPQAGYLQLQLLSHQGSGSTGSFEDRRTDYGYKYWVRHEHRSADVTATMPLSPEGFLGPLLLFICIALM